MEANELARARSRRTRGRWVRDCQTFDGAIIVRHDAYLRRLRSARTALLFGTLA